MATHSLIFRKKAFHVQNHQAPARFASIWLRAIGGSAAAHLQSRGGEFRVNATIGSDQINVATAMDGDGDVVVVWQSAGQDGGGEGIYAQRYDAAGAAQGSEFRVNSTTAGDQTWPDVASDADGDFVVVWQSSDANYDGVYTQRYNAAGVAQNGQFLVNTFTLGAQSRPAVAVDADGDFVVAWQSAGQDGSRDGIYGQRYNAAGVAQGGEFGVNTTTADDQKDATIAIDTDGDFVVAWTSYNANTGLDVFAQRFTAAGAAQGGEFRVNSYTTGSQERPSAAIDADGDFVVVWQSTDQDGSFTSTYGQRYSAAGGAQGSEFRVNTHTDGSQGFPDVAMDNSGDFVVSWTSNPQESNSDAIYAQGYNSAGLAIGGEFRVNTTTSGDQRFSAIAMNGGGDFVVGWQSPDSPGTWGIYAQRYAVDADLRVLSTTASGQSTLTLSYEIADSNAEPFDVAVYRSTDTTFGGDIFTGTITISAAADLTIGLHTKTIAIGGGLGELALPGAGAADVSQDYYLLVVADPDDNIPEPTSGNNTAVFVGSYHLAGGKVYAHGGAAIDTIAVAPASANTRVTINGVATLYPSANVAGVDIRGHDGADKLTGGAALAKPLSLFGGKGNDTLTGGAAADLIFGGAGNDQLAGGLGDDVIDGEAGSDTWTYTGTSAADYLDLDWDALAQALVIERRDSASALLETELARGIEVFSLNAQNGDDDVDLSWLTAADRTAAGVTKVTLDGGNGADVLRGSGGADTIKGGAGAFDDTLYGGAGNDTLDGGSGNDKLFGEAGQDKLFGMDGDDSLDAGWDGLAELVDGGLGIDTCFFWTEENDINCEIFP